MNLERNYYYNLGFNYRKKMTDLTFQETKAPCDDVYVSGAFAYMRRSHSESTMKIEIRCLGGEVTRDVQT